MAGVDGPNLEQSEIPAGQASQARLDATMKKVIKTHTQLINELKEQISLLEETIQKVSYKDRKVLDQSAQQ